MIRVSLSIGAHPLFFRKISPTTLVVRLAGDARHPFLRQTLTLPSPLPRERRPYGVAPDDPTDN